MNVINIDYHSKTVFLLVHKHLYAPVEAFQKLSMTDQKREPLLFPFLTDFTYSTIIINYRHIMHKIQLTHLYKRGKVEMPKSFAPKF